MTQNNEKQSQGCGRTAVILLVSLIFVILALGAFSAVAGTIAVNKAVVQPVGDLFRKLSIDATPVILPDPVTIVLEVNSLARLETASMSLEKIITAEQGSDVLWGAFEESLIFVAHGEVIAGVDLAQLHLTDLVVADPVTVHVRMPKAEIFVAYLDNERSYVADRDTGVLTSADPQLETQVRRVAEDAIEAAAVESNIIQTADENAERYMRDFLTALGFETIIFHSESITDIPAYEQEVPKGFILTPAP